MQQIDHQEQLVSIDDRIASVGDRLTPTEIRIVNAIHDDPTLLAFGTVSDLAKRVQTSRPSIVRFATKLGFEGYVELQRQVREDVAQQLGTPGQRIRRPTGEVGDLHHDVEEAFESSLAALNPTTLRRLATPLVDAERIWILSGETSRAGAHALVSGLSMVRDGVHLVEQHNLGRDLSGATAADAAVVFDFARYRRSTVLAARAFADLGVTLVAITDGPLSPLASLTEHWCELSVPAIGPFDSSMPAVLASELIIANVVDHLQPDVRERIDRLEKLWEVTDAFFAE
ncbi:MAG: MurR/RpiR family transcriptional regulator [Planctomycetota bacterium]